MIVFLDIDGVLNSVDTPLGEPDPNCPLIEQIDYERVVVFKEILKRLPNPRIVLSSFWRLSHRAELAAIFELWGVPLWVSITSRDIFASKQVLGYTEVCCSRAVEIKAWLESNGNPSSYIILDDNWIIEEQGEYGGITEPLREPFYRVGDGLTEWDIDKIVKLANKFVIS